MSKRFKHTKTSIEKRIKEGYGKGRGASYKPWVKIQDFASRGQSQRIPDCEHGRLRHLVSTLERRIFYLYWWGADVEDIREQFPLLPQEETLDIAKEIGVRHPIDKETQYPSVMTSDFLLSVRSATGNKYLARTAKYSSALLDPRVLEKFEIERIYWERNRKIDWSIVTNENLPVITSQSIKWVYPYYNRRFVNNLTDKEIILMKYWLLDQVSGDKLPVTMMTRQADIEFNHQKGTSKNVLRYLIARKHLNIQMDEPIWMARNLTVLNTNYRSLS